MAIDGKGIKMAIKWNKEQLNGLAKRGPIRQFSVRLMGHLSIDFIRKKWFLVHVGEFIQKIHKHTHSHPQNEKLPPYTYEHRKTSANRNESDEWKGEVIPEFYGIRIKFFSYFVDCFAKTSC